MIDEVLYYGYNPACGRHGLSSNIKKAVSNDIHTDEESELVEMGQSALQDAVEGELQRVGINSTHVIPLSSGLDSRTILGYLLAHTSIKPEQIQTVSFGRPGSWDYEIGQQVAAETGVGNISIDLTSDSFDWSVEQLRTYAATRSCPIPMFEGYVNATAVSEFEAESVVWSGFLGGESAGAHQPTEPTADWDTAKEYFAEFNRATNYLTDTQFDPVITLPPEPYIDRQKLSYEEQLDLAHRQQCFIAPVVLPDPERYAMPFTHLEWLSFSLNLPYQHREDRSMFINIVTQRFPELFSLPTDANNGLPLSPSPTTEFMYSFRRRLKKKILRHLPTVYTSPRTNYVNFDQKFRQKGQLSTTVKTLLSAFDERDIATWLDAEELWNRHQSGEDLAREIRIVCSLELFYDSR